MGRDRRMMMNLLYTHASAFGIFCITCKRLIRTCPLFAFKYGFFLFLSPNSNKEKPTSLLLSPHLSFSSVWVVSWTNSERPFIIIKKKSRRERWREIGWKEMGIRPKEHLVFIKAITRSKKNNSNLQSSILLLSLLSSQYPPSSPYFIFSENTPQFLSFYLLISF